VFRRYGLLFVVIFAVALLAVSCSGSTSSTSIDGAGIQVGAEVNDDLYIVSPKTNVAVGEDFYISFDNNASIGTGVVTLLVEDSESKEVIEEISYEVDPEWTIIVTEQLYFPDPGKFKISFIVNDEVRATQEVIVGE
jgi:hypothetical protein